MKYGDKVLLADNTYGIVQRVEVKQLATPETTYNFEVKDFHTYYVGENSVLVHNACGSEMQMTRRDAVKHGKEFLGDGYTKMPQAGMYKSADGLRTMHFDLTHHMYKGVPSPAHIYLYTWKTPVSVGVRTGKAIGNIHIFFL